MANPHQQLGAEPGLWPRRLGFIAAGAILLFRAAGSYGGAWFAGGLGVAYILAYGRAYERTLLVVLAIISVTLGGEAMYFGIRQVLFIAIFIFFGRYAPISPISAISFYILGLFINIGITGQLSPLFMVGPSIILLISAAYLIDRKKISQQDYRNTSLKVGLLSAVSFVLPFIGAGSRSALIVWLSFSMRRISISLIVAGVLGALIVSAIPQLEVFDRISNSYQELTDPFPEYGINLRAVEAIIFLSWLQSASISEIIFGSKEIIYMPGDFLGYLYDPPFVPHNQLMGLIFQFGLFGFGIIVAYMVLYWRSISSFPLGRFVILVYLILGFVVVHGFVNQDISIVSSVLLYYLHKLSAERRRGSVARIVTTNAAVA